MMDRLNIEVGQVWFRDFSFFKVVDIENTDGEVWVITENLEDGEIDGDRVADFLDEYELSRSGKTKEVVVMADKPEVDEDNIARVIANAWCDAHITGMAGVVHPKENVPKPDMVNKPPHYKDASGIECKEITCHRDMPFSLGNAIKYLYRAGSKGDLLEDLKKAEWYLRVAYLNSEAVPEEVIRRLREVAVVRKTEAGRALNLISHHKIVAAYGVVKNETEKLEAGDE